MSIEEYFNDWREVMDLDAARKMAVWAASLGSTVCPRPKDVFRAFHLCPFRSVRAVVLGQDPYPTLRDGKPIATGIAFGNPPGTTAEYLSPSLKVLKDSVRGLYPPNERITFDVSLEKWEEQGVLMLNSALTCPVGNPGKHALEWHPFIEQLLKAMSSHSTGLVYVLLGSSARAFDYCIDKSFNHVLYDHHPAWYLRHDEDMPSDIWKRANNILVSQNGYGIQWCEVDN